MACELNYRRDEDSRVIYFLIILCMLFHSIQVYLWTGYKRLHR